MTEASERRDVLLVNPPPSTPVALLCAECVRLPPMGLACLGAALRQHGYSPTILDMRIRRNTKERFLTEFRRLRPKVVGFTVMTDYVHNAVRLARLIKAIDPQCWTVFGGAHPDFRAAEILNTGVVDIVAVKADGEDVVVELCDAAWGNRGGLERIRGIVFKDGHAIVRTAGRRPVEDLDSFPWPAWDLLSLEDYEVPLVHTTRGCVGHCKFCCEGKGVANRVRFRSIPHVMEELAYLYELGIRRISFSDDNFVTGRKRLEELCAALSASFPGLRWSCGARVDTVSVEGIRLMAESGCEAIHFGIESISKRTMDQVGKRFSLERLEEKIAAARELSIMIVLTFVLGLPDDTEEQIRESLAYAVNMRERYNSMSVFGTLTPFPGSEYGDHPEKYGITIHSRNYDHYNTLTPIISTPHLTRRRLQNLQCEFSLAQIDAIKGRAGADLLRLKERGFVDQLGRLTIGREDAAVSPVQAPEGVPADAEGRSEVRSN